MRKYTKKVISILLTLVIFSVSGILDSYANSKPSGLTKGHVIIINTQTNKMGYFEDGKIVKNFNVATGKSSTPTPTGKTTIVNKIKNRPYYSGGIPGGDPRNPLGDRWLGLYLRGTYGTTYGIHGNNNESSIGKFVSGGCIRMHNSEVRWLFDRVPVGTTVIIAKSSKSFVDIAASYGVKLYNENEITTNMKNVDSKYKQFYIYGPKENPQIDLSNKNQLIKRSSDAKNILKKTVDGKKHDRQIYLDAWNKLNSNEKKHPNMVKINNGYNNIINIAESAESNLKFYENVKRDANNLIKDKDKAANLNKKDNMMMGARGKAYKEYEEAKAYGENSGNSPRLKYINEKYLDGVSFLKVAEYIGKNDLNKAKLEAAKIKDSYLKKIAEGNTKYTKAQQDVINKYKQLYIYGPSKNPIIDLSNKGEIIAKSSDATNILKKIVDGKTYDRQIYLDSWNKLSASEKQHPEMQIIDKNYNNIINIVEAAEANLKFYEGVKKNASEIISNPEMAMNLNSKDNMSIGARGQAYKEYEEAKKSGENSKNSQRMKYINKKYLDTLSFLKISEYLGVNDINKAKIELAKIEDKALKDIADYTIKNIK